MKKLSIIIPAYNEEKRIERTLKAYYDFFHNLERNKVLRFEIIVVLNGCVDKTLAVVQNYAFDRSNVHIIDIQSAGKGLAIKAGFSDALTRDNDYIGFVDADMATSPEMYYELVENISAVDGVIASRYIEGAQVVPARPLIKRWGSKLFYESLVYILLGLEYHDLQCGAKLFQRTVIATIIPLLQSGQWAFDVEILYLCKRFNFSIKEIPTIWLDQDGSKLKMTAGFRMLASVAKLRSRFITRQQTSHIMRYVVVVVFSGIIFFMINNRFFV